MNLRFVIKVEKFIVFYWRWGTEGANKDDSRFSVLSNLMGPDQWIIRKGTDMEITQAFCFDVRFETAIREPGEMSGDI